MIPHNPRIRHQLLPLGQPPHLVRRTQHEPSHGRGDEGLTAKEDGDTLPCLEAVGIFLGRLGDTVGR